MILLLVLPVIEAFGGIIGEIRVQNQEKIEVIMSQNDVNRIAIVNDEIKSVFASQDKVHIIAEEDNGQIFVTPRLKNNVPFTISLVTRSGATIDMLVTPHHTSSQTILLRLDKRSDEELLKEKRKYQSGLRKLISACLKGKVLKGYRILEHEDSTIDKDNKSLIQKKSYIGSQYKILVFDYINRKKTTQIISEQMFKMSPNAIAVVIQEKSLKPNQTTRIVIVENNQQQIKHLKR